MSDVDRLLKFTQSTRTPGGIINTSEKINVQVVLEIQFVSTRINLIYHNDLCV